MELALTFGAVGDFLAISLLIKDIVMALDDCRGSSKAYQDLVCSLTILDDAIREVDRVFRDPRRASNNKSLSATALKGIQQIQQSLQNFNEQLQKFRPSLSQGGSGNRIKDAAKKIQFKLEEKDLEKIKGEVTGYTVALKMMLEMLTLHTIEQNHEVVTKRLTTVEDETKETRRDLQTFSQSLRGYALSLGRQALAKIAFLTDTTLEIKNSTAQIASTVMSISRELVTFRFLLMTMARPPMEEYFMVEDALGRVFPIHLRTITSWDAFAFVLSEKFKGGVGARRVRDKRYNLVDNGTRREIQQGKKWERAFLPHQKIVMSLLCKDTEVFADVGRLATCPRCQTQSTSDTSVQVQCQNCNMFYTRVVELDPEQTKSNGTRQPRKKLSNAESALVRGQRQRRKRSIDSDMKDSDLAPGVRAARRIDQESSSKRTTADGDKVTDSDASESDEEDISGLVRVTIVTRRKRKALFRSRLGGHPSGLTAKAVGSSPSEGATADATIESDATKTPTIALKKRRRETPYTPKFACPFNTFDPQRFKGRSCLGGWTDIHRVREHLRRAHMLPRHQCNRCLEKFDNNDKLKAHLRESEPCPVKDPDTVPHNPEDNLDEAKLRRLGRSGRGKPSEERWKEMYCAIFDVDASSPDLPSPYYEPLPRDDESKLPAKYRSYMKKVLPLVQMEVQKSIEQAFSGVSEQLEAKLLQAIKQGMPGGIKQALDGPLGADGGNLEDPALDFQGMEQAFGQVLGTDGGNLDPAFDFDNLLRELDSFDFGQD